MNTGTNMDKPHFVVSHDFHGDAEYVRNCTSLVQKWFHRAASHRLSIMERCRMSSPSPMPPRRILKVARTIADLDSSANVQSQYITEAFGYRYLDRGDCAERGI